MGRRVAVTTEELRRNMDAFLAEFEQEFRTQATKHNRTSERRMRALLREFKDRVYVPYRDGTLAKPDPEDELPF